MDLLLAEIFLKQCVDGLAVWIQETEPYVPKQVGDCTVEFKFKKETFKSVPIFFQKMPQFL